MRRIAGYVLAWAFVATVAVIARFTTFAGPISERVFRLAFSLILATAAIFMVATVYESRRLAILCGYRGHGTFAYIRGWIKTAVIEIAANEDQLPPNALREWLL